MTEAEWQTCADPAALLAHLRDRGRLGERQLRRFACACVRRVWPLLADDRLRRAVQVAERFADGRATVSELRGAFEDAYVAADEAGTPLRDGLERRRAGYEAGRSVRGRKVYVRNLAMIHNGRYHLVLVIGPDTDRREVDRRYEQATSAYDPR